MRCPYCGHVEDRVVDSRETQDGQATRRRRACLSCERRFTTYERIEEVLPQVVKKDGRREAFDRRKIVEGVAIACQKRPVSAEQVEALVAAVERQLQELGGPAADLAYAGPEIVSRKDPARKIKVTEMKGLRRRGLVHMQADRVDRRRRSLHLSSRGRVIVREKYAPIVGNVCMDLTLVDVTQVPGVEVGDEVTLIGCSKRGAISAWEHASLAMTVPYEILCTINKQILRKYVR